LPAASLEEIGKYGLKVAKIEAKMEAAFMSLEKVNKRMKVLKTAISRSTSEPGRLEKLWFDINQELLGLSRQMFGYSTKSEIGEKRKPNIFNRMRAASSSAGGSTYGPTAMHKRCLEIAVAEFAEFKKILHKILKVKLPALEKAMKEAGAPIVK
jgi:hypothetical protein